ncbi:MAG: chorismate synthase [Clostridiales Family XIII bacterium]|jgi:chorismate synthase|nr:chorismate synthase [Clostridiales Family XIII bacterium]
MNTWGDNIRISIFGESHGPAIGAIIDGLPPGLYIDDEFIAKQMARRAPGRAKYSTARSETDIPRIMSGVKGGITTGAPLLCLIENADTRSQDYDVPLRPGHADWTGLLKYSGFAERAGGGHFSGRLTAPLVFAGALAQQLLSQKDIYVYGRIRQIGDLKDDIDLTGRYVTPGGEDEQLLDIIKEKPFPADDDWEQAFKDRILAAKTEGDSVGGVVEVIAVGGYEIEGIGEPFFGSVESKLSSLLFSVPAVKGVEFGKGFELARMQGSAANDPLRVADGRVISATNNNGGVLGGIATGMPLIVRAAIKPTASIAKEQDTVNPESMSEVRTAGRGRHDPCIVPRAVPVIEACMSLAILDLLLAK